MLCQITARRLADWRVSSLVSISFHSMTTNYRNFNTSTFQGRIFDATVTEGKYGEFVAITVIHNLADDDGGCTITFNNSNGLLALAKKGHLTRGRMVHVTGNISGVSEVYKKDGQVQLRKRPQITLDSKSAQLMLGALPKQETPQRPAAGTVVVKRVSEDPTPEIEPMVQVDDLGIPVN